MSTDASAGYRTVGNRLQRVHALEHLPDQRGRVVLVTGGTDGVGRALVDQMAGTGATVLLTARNRTKGAAVRDAARATSGNDDVSVVDLDLASLASVREAAAAILSGWERLDVLICNAAHQAGKQRTVTVDGFETTFAVNHLGHALLVQLLEERVVASAPSTILVVASQAHRRSRGGLDFDDIMLERGDFRPRLAYSRSKLANILFARELARHLAGTGVDVNAAHPGGVDTPMMRGELRASRDASAVPSGSLRVHLPGGFRRRAAPGRARPGAAGHDRRVLRARRAEGSGRTGPRRRRRRSPLDVYARGRAVSHAATEPRDTDVDFS